MDLNDLVENTLKGVLAYLIVVEFSEGSEWVVLRLTGESVIQGNKDGSFKGKRYFEDLGMSNGAFIRRGLVKKIQPSKLEELRLRRKQRSKADLVSTAIPKKITSDHKN